MKINNNTFICQLSQDKQDKIKHLLSCYLHDEELIVGSKADEIIENVMNDRLSVIENVIDIEEFLE